MGKKYRGISDKTGDKLEELYEDSKWKNKIKLGSFRKPKPKSFKEWFHNTVISTLFLIICLIAIWYLVRQETFLSFVIEVLLSYPIVYFMLALHESFHALSAQRLGYQYDFSYKKGRGSIDVYHYEDDKWRQDKVTILLFPYIIILPVSIQLAIVGIYYLNWALILGFGGTFVHQLAWFYFDYKGAMKSERVTS